MRGYLHLAVHVAHHFHSTRHCLDVVGSKARDLTIASIPTALALIAHRLAHRRHFAAWAHAHHHGA